MSLPTILLKGHLEATGFGPPQEELDKYLPVDYFLQRLEVSPRHLGQRVLLLQGNTGSGKSTVLPPAAYYRFFKKQRRNIACTQPRVLTARTLPHTIIPHYQQKKKPLKLGYNIGYQTRAFQKKPTRGLVYMTIGVLAQQLATMKEEDFMRKYFLIFLDEAHERSVATDLAFYSLKNFMTRHWHNPLCPFLVVMSATFDIFKYADYFLSSLEPEVRYQSLIQVRGFSFPIHKRYLSSPADNYLTTICNEIKKFQEQEPPERDILVFVPGLADLKQLKSLLARLPLIILQLTRADIQEESADFLALPHPPPGKRRVIISTNVAETGLTIPRLFLVIDSGWYNTREFFPVESIDSLVLKPVSQNMHRQRCGRVGREAPGEALGIFTEEVSRQLPEEFPEMLRADISAELLGILLQWEKTSDSSSDEPRIYELGLLDEPSADSLHAALEKLFVLGALDITSRPTPLGRLLGKFRPDLPLEHLRMILAGYAWGASISDLATVAAGLQVGRELGVPEKATWEEEKYAFLLYDDFLRYPLLLWELRRDLRKAPPKFRAAVEKRGLSYEVLMEILELRDELLYTLAGLGLNPFSGPSILYSDGHDQTLLSWARAMKQCIFEGFKLHLAEWHAPSKKYLARKSHYPFSAPSTWNPPFPRFLVYDSLLLLLSKKNIYQGKTTHLSVLDGYIPVDTSFDW